MYIIRYHPGGMIGLPARLAYELNSWRKLIRRISMRKFRNQFLLGLVVVLSLGFYVQSYAYAEDVAATPVHAVETNNLITMVEHNAMLKTLLVKSIAAAKQINPDRVTNPVQSLDEYYEFIDWATKAMPWSILPDIPQPKLYEKIDQSLDYFYFINDQPLAELKGETLYNNSLQYFEPYRSWMVLMIKNWGMYLSTEVSWNDQYYQMAYTDTRFGLQNNWYEDPSNWHSFNQFFSRYLRSPGVRPLTAPADDSVVISPADSKPQGVWKIDDKSIIIGAGNAGVPIKSNLFKSAEVLLGEDSAYKKSFANGTLTHTFLDVNDYHRYHFPVSGVIKEVRIIESDDAAGGVTLWDAKLGKYILESSKPGWQNIETRGCVIIETPKYGLVAVLPIGMSQVSSVNFEKNVTPGTRVAKGDMLGTFLFGGSDIVMLFQSTVNFKFTVPEDTAEPKTYQHLLMGQEYGRLSRKK
jgi:Phosphatidylserine decarboxylase